MLEITNDVLEAYGIPYDDLAFPSVPDGQKPDDDKIQKLKDELMERESERLSPVINLLVSCVALKCIDPASRDCPLVDMESFFCNTLPKGGLDAHLAELARAAEEFLRLFDEHIDIWLGEDRTRILSFDFARQAEPDAEGRAISLRTSVLRTLGSMRRHPLFDLDTAERKSAHELVCKIAITLLQIILDRMESAGYPFKIKYISDTLLAQAISVVGCSDGSIRGRFVYSDAPRGWRTNKFFKPYVENNISPSRLLLAACGVKPLQSAHPLATLKEIGETVDLVISEDWAIPKPVLDFFNSEIAESSALGE